MRSASDWVGVLNVAHNVANEESSLNKNDDTDMPSFSLGLTQDFARKVNEVVPNITEPDSHVVDQISKGKDIHNDSDLIECEEQGKFAGARKVLKTYQARNRGKITDKKGKGVGEFADKRETRSQHLLRKTNVLVSPYLIRPVVANDRLDMTTKQLYLWIMDNDAADVNEVVYSDTHVEIM
ncbi:hypothetical protein C2S53_020538 [Perilla frutescens var. hirtella]|uniref:Uncharacterized protein n=1 Tax=Perilla frutescens var. hirtella TaxID=608512 RepID=A0AAD4NZC4_PERFH|nr:hypothetical protein C2S53_020538 [Perilla frutescens var. hirtella]